MGRPRQPIKVLELRGSTAHDKKRYASRVAAADVAAGRGGVGEPPAHWSMPCSIPPGAREAIWHEKVAEFPPGLLTVEHRALLEQLCTAIYESRRPGKMQLRYIAEVTKILRLFGMTPLDREKVNTHAGGPAKPVGKLAAFVNRRAG